MKISKRILSLLMSILILNISANENLDVNNTEEEDLVVAQKGSKINGKLMAGIVGGITAGTVGVFAAKHFVNDKKEKTEQVESLKQLVKNNKQCIDKLITDLKNVETGQGTDIKNNKKRLEGISNINKKINELETLLKNYVNKKNDNLGIQKENGPDPELLKSHIDLSSCSETEKEEKEENK